MVFSRLFELRKAEDINKEAHWARNASHNERTPANPYHGDTETGFWDGYSQGGANQPRTQDDCADFVRIASTNAILVVFTEN